MLRLTLALAFVALTATTGLAQCCEPTVSTPVLAPVTTYYSGPVTANYAAPAAVAITPVHRPVYYGGPVVAAVPYTAYYAPAPVVVPYTSYYAPAVVPAPALVPAPAVVYPGRTTWHYYPPGQPVRNVIRAVLP